MKGLFSFENSAGSGAGLVIGGGILLLCQGILRCH